MPAASELKVARDQAEDYLALAQRTKADFENFRKRMARENAAAIDRGMAKLAKELLPAHRSPGARAQGGRGPRGRREGLRDGRAASCRPRSRASGIQAFSPSGEVFDPNEHEAMAQLPSDGAESGTVIEVYQSGYRINGAVLRPARVVVAA